MFVIYRSLGFVWGLKVRARVAVKCTNLRYPKLILRSEEERLPHADRAVHHRRQQRPAPTAIRRPRDLDTKPIANPSINPGAASSAVQFADNRACLSASRAVCVVRVFAASVVSVACQQGGGGVIPCKDAITKVDPRSLGRAHGANVHPCRAAWRLLLLLLLLLCWSRLPVYVHSTAHQHFATRQLRPARVRARTNRCWGGSFCENKEVQDDAEHVSCCVAGSKSTSHVPIRRTSIFMVQFLAKYSIHYIHRSVPTYYVYVVHYWHGYQTREMLHI